MGRSNVDYTPIDTAYPVRLRGTNQQTDVGLLYQPPRYNVGGSVPRGPGLALGYFALHNRSASSLTAAGIGVRIPNYLWIAGQWTDSTTTFTEDTRDAQGRAPADLPLEH